MCGKRVYSIRGITLVAATCERSAVAAVPVAEVESAPVAGRLEWPQAAAVVAPESSSEVETATPVVQAAVAELVDSAAAVVVAVDRRWAATRDVG